MTATLIAGTSIARIIRAEVARWITPALGGVGPVTVAPLLRHAVLATRM